MSILSAPGSTSGQLKPEIEQLFREHSEMLYCTAYSVLGSRADAEDVLQTLFLRLLRRESPPEMVRNARGYLYRAALNLSLNMIRSRKRTILAGDASYFEDRSTEDSASNSAEESHRRLTKAIAELSPKDAEVLILRYIHNQTDAAIAKLLGVSRSTIAMRVFRSKLRLKKLIGDEK